MVTNVGNTFQELMLTMLHIGPPCAHRLSLSDSDIVYSDALEIGVSGDEAPTAEIL
jgi:hypothetical protein